MKPKEKQSILEEARKRLSKGLAAESRNRQRAKEDRRIRFGYDIWPEALRREREQANLPSLTFNLVDPSVRKIINDHKLADITLHVVPADGGDKKTADIIGGIVRQIEQDSDAESAQDWALDCAVTGNVGYFEVVPEYASEGSFQQIIKVKRIFNPDSVTLDSSTDDASGEGAKWAIRTMAPISDQEFKAKYPRSKGKDDFVASEIGDSVDDWYSKEGVRLAKYYRVNETPVTLYQFADGTISHSDDEAEFHGGIARQRSTVSREVWCYLLSGSELLESSRLACDYIPIIRVLGRESLVDDRRERKGAVTDLIDAVKTYCYARSVAIETVALQTKTPFIGPRGSMTDPKWRTAHRINHPYLEYEIDPVREAGNAPRREPPPQPNMGMLEVAMSAAQDIKAMTGIYDAALGAQSNEHAGVAIAKRQQQSEVVNADFSDNFRKAIKYYGKVIVSMISKIYVEPREQPILDDDKKQRSVVINEPYIDDQKKPQHYDITAGKYDVAVDDGPSYATQRQEARESLTEIVNADPQRLIPLLGDVLANNFDWKGSEKVAERLATLLPPEVLSGENPQFAMALQQKDAEIQSMGQQVQQLMGYIEQLNRALQDKDREMTVKEKDLVRKIQADLNKHIEAMTGHEIDANRDLGAEGAYM